MSTMIAVKLLLDATDQNPSIEGILMEHYPHFFTDDGKLRNERFKDKPAVTFEEALILILSEFLSNETDKKS